MCICIHTFESVSTIQVAERYLVCDLWWPNSKNGLRGLSETWNSAFNLPLTDSREEREILLTTTSSSLITCSAWALRLYFMYLSIKLCMVLHDIRGKLKRLVTMKKMIAVLMKIWSTLCWLVHRAFRGRRKWKLQFQHRTERRAP